MRPAIGLAACVLLVLCSDAFAFVPTLSRFVSAQAKLGASREATATHKWSMTRTQDTSSELRENDMDVMNRRHVGKMMAGILLGGGRTFSRPCKDV
jgi:hypothetical protein